MYCAYSAYYCLRLFRRRISANIENYTPPVVQRELPQVLFKLLTRGSSSSHTVSVMLMLLFSAKMRFSFWGGLDWKPFRSQRDLKNSLHTSPFLQYRIYVDT